MMHKKQGLKSVVPDLNISLSTDDERTVLIYSDVSGSYQSIDDAPKQPPSGEKKGSIFSSVFTLVSTMNGGGILSMPFAFHQGGYLVASVVLLVCCFASAYSSFLIIRSKKYCVGKVKNIEDVGKVAFGKQGQVLAQIVLIGFCYFCVIAYMLLFTDQMKPLLMLLVGPDSYITKKISLLSIGVLVVLPLALLKNLSALRYTSAFSMMCSLFVCACVAYRSSKEHLGGPINNPDNPIEWYPRSFHGFLTCVAIIEVAFTCHYNILPMHCELKNRTTNNKRIIIIISMIISYIANLVISFFGYFQFRMFTQQDITQNYSTDDIAVNCARGALCCSLLLGCPLLIMPCRSTINKIIWQKRKVTPWLLEKLSNDDLDGPNKWMWFFETIIFVTSTYLLAYVIPEISIVWGFMGAVLSTALIYILPPMFYLRVRKKMNGRFKVICAYCLLGFGAVLLVVGVYQGVGNVIAPLLRHGNTIPSNGTSHHSITPNSD